MQLIISDEVISCSKCLYNSSHPFGLTFSSGLCSGCFTHNEKDTLDWNKRSALLNSIIEDSLAKNKSHYDCVIPVQGDAEDYYVVSKALSLNLKPLIVLVNDYFFNDIGWHNFHNLITYFDLDSIVYNPDILTYKEMIRTTLRKINHILWPSISLRTSFPVHIAKQRNIPIVLWGQNQAIEQVGKFSHTDSVQMSHWYRKEHDQVGYDLTSIIGSGAQINTKNLNYYRYPDIKMLGHSKVIGIYLSNFMRWDPLQQNQKSLSQGFQPQSQTGTFDIYERAGNSVYYGLHDLLKQQRVGYRKIRDQLSREIRHGRISRKSALYLEEEYSNNQIDVSDFFSWLDVTKSGQQWFINKRLQDVRHLIGTPETTNITIPNTISDLLSASRNPAREFVLFGKGVSL